MTSRRHRARAAEVHQGDESSQPGHEEGQRGRGAPFEPVRTKADLESLNQDDILEGYMSAERGDPEPGENRGRAFWHGWRNRMIDMHEFPMDEAAMQLVREMYPCRKIVTR